VVVVVVILAAMVFQDTVDRAVAEVVGTPAEVVVMVVMEVVMEVIVVVRGIILVEVEVEVVLAELVLVVHLVPQVVILTRPEEMVGLVYIQVSLVQT
jgi:hypothetical protein